ncbi:MAG: aminotransferase class I/II-fold pyridoxal phosphate-dependent enzyme [Bacillota bacterium]
MGSLDPYLQQLKQDATFRGFFKLVCLHGEKIAAELLEEDQIKTVTYAQQAVYSRATAKRIRERLPVEPGTRFAGLRMDNGPMWPVMFWSLVMAGLNPLLLDTRHQPEQVEHLLKQVDAIALFTTDTSLNVTACATIAISEVLDNSGAECAYEPVWAKYYALCTSGTTATSKVYYYEAKTLCAQVGCISSLTKDFAYTDAPYKSLAFLPFNHVFGLLAVFFLCNFFGGTIVYLTERTPAVIVNTCKRHKVTHVFAVPLFWNNVAQNVMRKAKLGGPEREAQLQKLVRVSLMLQRRFPRMGRKMVSRFVAGKVQDALLGRDIRLTITGGGHILPDAMQLINVLGYQLVNGFGMTEIGIASVETTTDVDLRNAASTGKPMPGIEYYVLTDEGIKPEGVGELLVKSAYVHNGRYINGVDTGPEVDAQGYFHTGDVARIKGGRLWLEGRLKEVIINESGENVYPDELEDAFLELSHAEQICITGVDTGQTYEDITMAVYMGDARGDENSVRELAETFSKANAPLPVYKKVRTVIVTREPMPLANGIKVKRQTVRRMIEDGSLAYDVLDVREGRLVYKGNAEETVQTPAVTDEAGLRAIKDEIKAIFGEVLSLKPEEISDTAHFIYDLGGDSLSSLAVFIKAEEKYGVLISDTDYYGCENVNDLANLLYAKMRGVDVSAQKDVAASQAVRRVETFEQSREYDDFMLQLRIAETVGNPFFISHDSVLRDTSIVDGRRVLNFASYNYLGLSGHPETMRAAQEAIEKYGTSASGSRLLAGEKPLYRELEAKIASWKHTEDALVLVGGHSTNVTFVGNFCNKHDLILYDALSHNSITQGCQLSPAETKAFPHNDYEALESILKANRDRYEKVLIVVEGVYSMDGDIAPIKEFVRIKRAYGAFLMVDEAHSGCVIGERGGGVDDYFNLAPDDIDIKMGTLSKGLGTCGGYLAGRKIMIDYLRYNVPGFVFSVGISPPLAAATKRAIELIEESPELVQKLHANIRDFMEIAQAKGFNTCLAKESSIIPILIGKDEDAALLSRLMLENGVFVPPAVFPAVPRNQARLRFCVISEHNREQIETALNTLERLIREHGVQTAKRA